LASRNAHVPAVIAITSILSACGGSDSSMSPAPGNPTAGGIWRGEASGKIAAVGLGLESGEFRFLRSDDVQLIGTLNVSGTAVSGMFSGYTPNGFKFPDGSTHGTGSLSGTIQPRQSLQLMGQLTTDGGSTISNTLSLSFDPIYYRPSSLAILSGNFLFATSGAVLTINSDGSMFAQEASSGCVLNGSATTVDASYNVYRVQFSYASCRGDLTILNGVPFSGLAALDSTLSPEHIVIGVTDESGATNSALVYSLGRT
jgi:hypothetical protein